MTYQKKYFRRAKKTAFFLLFLPFVRAIFLTGSLARNEATKESDIDFFIITKPGRIWTCRALVTIVVQLIGIRRYGNKIAGRICLNRYQTEDNLEILPHNTYHANDYSQAIALVDLNNIETKYRKANAWIKKFKNHPKIHQNHWPNYVRIVYEKILSGNFGDFLEKKLKKYQKKRIFKDPRTLIAEKGKIVANDKALCFHPRQHNS